MTDELTSGNLPVDREGMDMLLKQLERDLPTGARRLHWTNDKPDRPGWYWYRNHRASSFTAVICWVDATGVHTVGCSIGKPYGQFAGPIKEPV